MLTFKQYLEENSSLEEIKLATIGKIIKHSPKIAYAALGVVAAAHTNIDHMKPIQHSEITSKQGLSAPKQDISKNQQTIKTKLKATKT